MSQIRYLVSALGMSLLCADKDAVIRAMKEMVEKGGTPTVQIVSDPKQEASK